MDILKTQTTDSVQNISFFLTDRTFSTEKNSFFFSSLAKRGIWKGVGSKDKWQKERGGVDLGLSSSGKSYQWEKREGGMERK